MVLDWLREMFSGAGSDQDADGLHVYLRCDACGEKISLRLNPETELSRDFQQGGYYVRKVAVGQRCFKPIEVSLRFDDSFKRVSHDISGGELLSREEYEAAGA